MIEIEGLGLSFRRHDGGRDAPLADVSIRVQRGELVGLVGGSGAGKSLVAETLMGMLPRNAERLGRIIVDGQEPARCSLAMAPQGRDALDPLARVGRQVERHARLSGRKVDVVALFASLGLSEDVVHAWPHELSGGMAKRVLIATALATGAEGLIADEPTSGLHPEAADQVMALLGDLARRGRAVLVISHDLPRLVAVAHRVVVLREGRPVETAEACAFATGSLSHPFSRDLWGAQGWASAGAC